MRAKLELAFQQDAYRVWVYEPGPRARRLVLEDGATAWLELDPHEADPPPSFVIPAGALEAIAEELGRKGPTGAGADAIEDARATRDRLLALVEHVVKPEPPDAELAPATPIRPAPAS